jgi:mannose/fructose/N-acetylgalactosamine-specific phosphotransferase system component IIB
MVVLVRIDDRLIHGQVVEGWVNYLKATCIVVADDRVAANALQRSIMEVSAPEGLKVVIDTVEAACARLRSSPLDRERAIVLFSNPTDALRSLKAGLQCTVVNVGGMHSATGKRKILDVLSVDVADLAALREIVKRGVKVMVQTVPTERPQPIEKMLNEAGAA